MACFAALAARALRAAVWLAAGAAAPAAGAHAALAPWAVAEARGADLACLREHHERQLTLLACAAACAPIPWQLDERDAEGRWALRHGPEPNPDAPPRVLDDDDVLVWMAADAGRRARRAELPAAARCVIELRVTTAETTAWVYALAFPGAAPRAARRYVEYDPARDLVYGAHLALGFGAATPRLLAVRAADGTLGPNLLDRLKVRASARFFGFIPLGRDEDDIAWRFSAWDAGPIRVLRREYQWVRLGFGLRTPIFETESLITRDRVVLPVRLRLNFPPTYFFSAIEVQAALDFRDLRGWQVVAAGSAPLPVGAGTPDLDGRRGDWIALRGAEATLLLELVLGDSLASLAPTILHRESARDLGPEAVRGELPGVGFRLTEWSAVDRGTHAFAAVAYALPPGFDLAAFAALRGAEPTVSAAPLPP